METNTNNIQQKRAWIGFLVILVLAVIIVAIATRGFKKNDKKTNEEVTPLNNTIQVMEPVTVGSFVYQFQGVNWVFEPNDEEGVGVPLTDVKVWLDKFSRHAGSYVTFENPYKLGTYRGDCVQVDTLDFDTTVEKRLLAYAQCTWNEEVVDITVFQDGQSILFKKRISGDSQFELLYSIDITTIVK